jgi:acetyl esterase/lipase
MCLGIVCAGVASCTALGTLNAVMPKGNGTEEVISAVEFGEHPRQRLDVYVPKEIGVKAPVVVFFYGGSWKGGKRQDYAFVGHAFNAEGYIAVIPDYRLVPEVRYPDFLIDNANALRWVAAHISDYGGDPERLFVLGHSAGAYNALMLGLATEMFAENGLTLPAISAAAGLAGPYDFIPMVYQATKDAFEGVPDLPSTQPVNLVSPESPPMLLVTGTEDELVSPKHSHSLQKSSEENRANSTLLTYEGVGHIKLLLSLGKPFHDSTPAFEDIIDFFSEVEREHQAVE